VETVQFHWSSDASRQVMLSCGISIFTHDERQVARLNDWTISLLHCACVSAATSFMSL